MTVGAWYLRESPPRAFLIAALAPAAPLLGIPTPEMCSGSEAGSYLRRIDFYVSLNSRTIRRRLYSRLESNNVSLNSRLKSNKEEEDDTHACPQTTRFNSHTH